MKKQFVAFVERVSSTFLFAFIGVVLATGDGVGVSALKAAAVAGGLSVAKYLYTLAGAYLAKPDPLLNTATVEHTQAVTAAVKAVTEAVAGSGSTATETAPAPPGSVN